MNAPVDQLYLRLASAADCRLIWEWANDPETRALSFSSEPIPWETHVQWFQGQIDCGDCVFFIAANAEGTPIGQVRYVLNAGEAVISISLDRQFRGQGYGTTLIKLACLKLKEEWFIDRIHAYIKPDNMASLKAFAKAGFQSAGREIIHNLSAEHLILTVTTQAMNDPHPLAPSPKWGEGEPERIEVPPKEGEGFRVRAG